MAAKKRTIDLENEASATTYSQGVGVLMPPGAILRYIETRHQPHNRGQVWAYFTWGDDRFDPEADTSADS